MRLISLLAGLVLFAPPAVADPRAELYGTWGTEGHCARSTILPGGTARWEPYEIRPGWLRHGQVWCRLTWFPVSVRENGVFTGAHAVCGEDMVRTYNMRMVLEDEILTLKWDIFQATEPLGRCPLG